MYRIETEFRYDFHLSIRVVIFFASNRHVLGIELMARDVMSHILIYRGLAAKHDLLAHA